MSISRLAAAALVPCVLVPAALRPLTAQAPAPTSPGQVALRADSGAAKAAPAPTPAPAGTAAATAPAFPNVSFFGEVRSRSELDHPVGAPSADAFTYLRSRLGARAAVSEGVRLIVEVQDSRVLGTEGQPGATNALDMYEGYLEIARPWRGTRLALRAGRQEIVLGNERLVGRVNWSNTGRSFDGVRLTAGPAGGEGTAAGAATAWSATAFASTLVERGARFGGAAGPSRPEADHYVFGLHAVRPLAALPRGAAELTVVHDRGVHARGREVTGRTTVAGRLRAGRVLGVSADLEGALQGGAQHALATATAPAGPRESIRSWMLGARVGTPADPKRRLSAAVGLDLLSGDATVADGRDGAFSTLYASNHAFYGLEDVVGGDPAASLKGHGLADAFATATYTVSRTLSLRTDLHRMSPARTGGLPAGPIGWEADVVAPLRIAPGAVIELGYGAFRADDAGAALGLGAPGRVRGWGYLQLTAGF